MDRVTMMFCLTANILTAIQVSACTSHITMIRTILNQVKKY